jgi:hypothetical protein
LLIPLFQVILGCPQEQHRAADLAPGPEVVVVVGSVDAQPGAVVLHHGVHGARVVDRALTVSEGFR